MNLIELVEQARAEVRVWDGNRLVAVVPVRYPEMLTCSSELPLDPAPVWYPVGADIEPFWSLSMACPTVPSGPPAPPVRCQLSTMEGGPF